MLLSDDPEVTGGTLEDILPFITGAKEIPPMGFDQPLKIEFIHGQRQPNASTCSLALRLPRETVNYGNFKDKLMLSILGAHGFGII